MGSGLRTELHPGDLRCHCCTVGKTEATKRVHWGRGDQGPRTDGSDEKVSDLGGGASTVASQMVSC